MWYHFNTRREQVLNSRLLYHILRRTVLTLNGFYYRQISNISCTFVGSQIVDHSDAVGASPVGAAPTTSSFST